MSLVPLVIDSPVGYAAAVEGVVPLLTLPLGTRSVLDHLLGELSSAVAGIGHVLVLPSFPITATYRDALQSACSSAVRVALPESLTLKTEDLESSDYLLIVEPRLWPMTGYAGAGISRRAREYRGATHAVCLGGDAGATHELVQLDLDGYVTRVQRFYNQMHWPDHARTRIAWSLVPARAVRGAQFRSLGELRTILSARGVLSRDYPLVCDTFDLSTGRGFLTLHERVLADVAGRPATDGFTSPAPEVLIGPGCRLHPSARIIAPVILQPDVTLEEGVTIVGPALVGAGSVLRRGASLVQGVLAAGTEVAEDVVVRHRVATGPCMVSVAGDDTPVEMFRDTRDTLGNPQAEEEPWTSTAQLPTRRRWVHLAIKRAMDVTASAAALLVLSPLLILVAILIKLDSRGPVFFTHRREQRGGREFPCVKFRTMVAGAHDQQRQLYQNNEVDGPQFKITRDPRVTRLGRCLRSTNIDELPQLLNVLAGHMSLIGPRPSPFRENQICVPWRLARLSVRPGITGLWQICRAHDRSAGDFHEWIYYDIAYVRHFSIWLDLKILVATLISLGGRWSIPMSWMIRASGHGPTGLSPTASAG